MLNFEYHNGMGWLFLHLLQPDRQPEVIGAVMDEVGPHRVGAFFSPYLRYARETVIEGGPLVVQIRIPTTPYHQGDTAAADWYATINAFLTRLFHQGGVHPENGIWAAILAHNETDKPIHLVIGLITTDYQFLDPRMDETTMQGWWEEVMPTNPNVLAGESADPMADYTDEPIIQPSTAPSLDQADDGSNPSEIEQTQSLLPLEFIPNKASLQQAIDAAIHNSDRVEGFIYNLEKQGITAIPNVAKTGRISGIKFQKDDTVFKGSELGKMYSWNGLSYSINFDPETDTELLRKVQQHGFIYLENVK